MVYKLKLLELHWRSPTSLAGVEPETKEVRPENFVSGKTWWFDWDANNHRLQFNAGDSELPPGPASCTTTLLYCKKDGFSSIPYNPLHHSGDHWSHWWSLGFTEGSGCYTIARDDKPDFNRKLIEGNGSRWFRLFRGTTHEMVVNEARHHEARHHEACHPPLLTGVPSLIWALAAFPFDIATLEDQLPDILRGRETLVLPELDIGEQSGRVSERALVVEIWAERGHDLKTMNLYLC